MEGNDEWLLTVQEDESCVVQENALNGMYTLCEKKLDAAPDKTPDAKCAEGAEDTVFQVRPRCRVFADVLNKVRVLPGPNLHVLRCCCPKQGACATLLLFALYLRAVTHCVTGTCHPALN